MVLTQILIDWLHLFTLAVAVGLLLHEVGLISLGHAGLLLAGAYGCAFTLLDRASLWTAGAVVFGLCAVMSAAVLRIRGDIFAVVTLAFAQILYRVAVGATSWTGGSLGLGPIPPRRCFSRS